MEIKAIDKGSVHRLCSGQVVLTLSTAVKELLENSLDAGAKNITIRLKNSGLDLIEVVDDGCGVDESNFQALTLKHFTSKISAFSDLSTVETFGFRGEALSSLCSLSKLSISTRTSTSKVASKITYDHNGNITSSSRCAREVGTTVTVEDLFQSLPVRRKELEKNITKEFNKMVTNISGYCLMCEGVKLNMVNQSQNRSSTVLKLNGNTSIKTNIIDVFGVKQWNCLVEFVMAEPDTDLLKEFNIRSPFHHSFKIEGYISSAEHGKGRSSSDRQFLFINKRPFDNNKITRLINEVYHMFNGGQNPFILINITTSTSSVDVNVTPDKRQVFMQDEKVLMMIIKASLKSMFSKTSSLCPSLSSFKLKRSQDKDGSPLGIKTIKKQRTLDDSIEVNLTESKPHFSATNSNHIDTKHTSHDITASVDSIAIQNLQQTDLKPLHYTLQKHNTNNDNNNIQHNTNTSSIQDNNNNINKQNNNNKNIQNDNIITDKKQIVIAANRFQEHRITSKQAQISTIRDHKLVRKTRELRESYDKDDKEFFANRHTVFVEFCMQDLRDNFHKGKNENDREERKERRFKAEINVRDNQKAEEELKRSVDKESFERMKVIGQFNLGFIITILDHNNLFIVDQHASDEKYNFEWLEDNVVLQNQKLICPQNLELTACNESILLENEDVFKANGFEFIINPDAPPTQRAKLISIPTSRNWVFGQQDIQEMIFVLSEAPKVLCRPSRIRQMLASRACRKSVMVGTALKASEMKKIVTNMAKMKQPWNCPHGRPTIRHLIDLNIIQHQSL